MNQYVLWAMFMLGAAAAAAGGYAVGLDVATNIKPEPCKECPEVDTDEQALLLMHECERCKNKEAKNWEDVAVKRMDDLTKCLGRIAEKGK